MVAEKLDVLADLPSPRKIFEHRVLDQPPPTLRAIEPIERGIERPHHGGTVVVIEHASGPRPRGRIVMAYRIRETAGAPNHRDGPVPQAVHLIQSAGFVLRRHEKHIAARLDQMRQRLVMAVMKCHAARITPGQRFEERRVTLIAAAEHHQGDVARTENLGKRVEQQIDSLLGRQAGHHADQRHRDRRAQPTGAEQLLLVEGLAVQFLDRIVRRQVRIVPRVPFLIIDAVEDADDAVLARPQGPLHSHAQ